MDFDVIATPVLVVCTVQWLVDVTDKMHEEPQGVSPGLQGFGVILKHGLPFADLSNDIVVLSNIPVISFGIIILFVQRYVHIMPIGVIGENGRKLAHSSDMVRPV